MDLCRFLRWKGYYGARWRTQGELDAALSTNEVPYSCLQTAQAWGPDDGVACPEHCDRSRSCFKISPKMPLVS